MKKHVKLYEEFVGEGMSWFPATIKLKKDIWIGERSNWTSTGKNGDPDGMELKAPQVLKLSKDGTSNERTEATYSATVTVPGQKPDQDFLTFSLKELASLWKERAIDEPTGFGHDITFQSKYLTESEIKSAKTRDGVEFKIGDTAVAPDNRPFKITGFMKGRDGHMKAMYNAGLYADVYNLDDIEHYHGKLHESETIAAKDIDHDTMDYLDRTNKKLLVTMKNGQKVKSSVGKFHGGLIFHGDFPENIQHIDYLIQKKHFEKIQIVEGASMDESAGDKH